jgi:Mg-chelatase subunit ChlD/HEAT repeat protein
MFRLLLASVCALATSGGQAPQPILAEVVTTARDGEPRKALCAWLKLYRQGKIAIYSSEILNRVPLVVDWRKPLITSKESLAVKYGLAPKGGLADPTWLGDLEVIAAAVAAENTAAAAEALLELAAVGFDDETYVRERAPDVVRGVGAIWAAKLSSAEARAFVTTAARGGLTGAGDLVAMQGAALRCLAAFGDPLSRAAIEPMLAHAETLVRFHAAEALGRLGDDQAAPALVAALEREQDEAVLPAIAEALRAVYHRYLPGLGAEPAEGGAAEKPPATAAGAPLPESALHATRAAAAALGRAGWRADMALLRLLDDFRSKESIPALIDVLQRYHDHPDQVQSGRLSTLVLHRAHELLVSMTGAVFPAAEPDKWRELWDRAKDEISVQKRHAVADTHTVASGFAGIPVQGSRVLFILDLSGSMNFPMTKQARTRAGNGKDEPAASSRIDFARRELFRAVEGLGEAQSFNLITFDGDDKARVWSKAMVPATNKNRDKLEKQVGEWRPEGGTNLWSALEQALKTKSLVYGDRYETNVDEIFLLSDGAPTVGEVLDPIEILRLVRESNRFARMRINTVFISSPTEEERRQRADWMTIRPEELMRRLAAENGGRCVIIAD